jgi:hypothetical protein
MTSNVSLAAHGFQQSSRSERLYYREGLKDGRFAFRKHYVNLERRVSGEWEIVWPQFLITRQLDEITQAIEDPVEAVKRGS